MLRAIRLSSILVYALALFATGCAQIPTSGPSSREVESAADAPPPTLPGIQLIDVDDKVARALARSHLQQQHLFSKVLGDEWPPGDVIGNGDTLNLTLWEAPPATLFGGLVDPREASSARSVLIPPQMVDSSGNVSVPFAGMIHVSGLTTRAAEEEIVRRLKSKANQPEAVVGIAHNASSNVTVVGEVNTSLRLPLTAGRERVLDAIAAAGGVRNPINKMTIQVSRGGSTVAMSLESLIRDPKQNVPLHPGDVVTAMFQPLSFTVLGATGKNDELPFEAQGITLAQAVARAGGLMDSRANAQGVYIFRFEDQGALDWPRKPVQATQDGRVPVIYRIDLHNAASLFVMQNFAIDNRDLLYVSNAPIAEAQKFLQTVLSVAYPVFDVINLTR
ncbi:MAG: polysaccharide biosynthesis/export family protein [Burkholderiaceae bacterium]|jgi:polysaccharide export outer membrane protein